MQSHLGSHWRLIGVFLLLGPAHALAATADEVMEKVIENLRGPAGTTLVTEGNMQFSRRNLHIRAARYWNQESEGFQIDVASPVEDQEVPGAIPQTNKKYRVVRSGMEIQTLTYLPSLRRGRKINYVPMDGILGSEYPYYLLPLASDFRHDFSYSYVREERDAPVIKGVRKEQSRSPYAQVELQLRKMGEIYVVEKARYEAPFNKGFTLLLQDFIEFTPGYWAPKKVVVGDTLFTFDTWKAWKPLGWLLSTNHGQLELQNLPHVTVIESNENSPVPTSTGPEY